MLPSDTRLRDMEKGTLSELAPALARWNVALTRVAFVLILILATWLRWIRFDLRFNQILFAYAAYFQPVVSAFEAGDWSRGWTTFVGLHPPLYSALFAALYHVWGAPGGYLVMSGVFSVGAVAATWLLGKEVGGTRIGFGAAVLMAVSVYQLHYALEVNNYPLLTLLATLGPWTFMRALRRPEHSRLAAWTLTLVAGVYTHALFAVVAAAQVMFFLAMRGRRDLARVGAVVAVSVVLCLPLVPPVLSLVASHGTYQNAPIPVSALWTSVAVVMARRFGPTIVAVAFPLLAVFGAIRGLARASSRLEIEALLSSLTVVPVIALLILAQVASAEQYPYYLVCLGPFLVLVALGVLGPNQVRPATRHAANIVFVILCAAELTFGLGEVQEASAAVSRMRRTPHAIFLARTLKPAADVLWLIAPPLHPDDDKRAVDPVYLELPRWQRCRYYGLNLGYEYVNYAYGQPYQCGDLVVHTFTDIYPAPMRFWLDHYQQQGDLVAIVMYDVETSPSYVPRLEDVLKPYHAEHRLAGTTHLFLVGFETTGGGERAVPPPRTR